LRKVALRSQATSAMRQLAPSLTRSRITVRCLPAFLNVTVARALSAAISRTAISTASISQSCASMKGVDVDLPDLAARGLAGLDDECRELRLEIAPPGRVVVEREPIGVFACVGGVDSFHKRLGGGFSRPRPHYREGGANTQSQEHIASRDHDGPLRSCRRISPC